MKEIILAKIGEMVLKGLNRKFFDQTLVRNLTQQVSKGGNFEVKLSQSTLYIIPKGEEDLALAEARISKVFGISNYSCACVTKKDMESIFQSATYYLKEDLEKAKTFKVECKRADKKFPKTSPDISAEVGGYLLTVFPHLKVDVRNPNLVLTVEIRDFGAFVRGKAIRGAGGMPVGTGGKAAVLLSGGIDSPVAAWMMAKRGVILTAIHFASPPYTSERATQKVVNLLEKVCDYAGQVELYIVHFSKVQEEIIKHCPEELFAIIMRRFMMRVAEKIARKEGCEALITGESLGQVASQTMQGIACTDAVIHMPVFRPLIGMDKLEIIEISRKMDTFEISIQPFEDCCTIFTPRHPKTKPDASKMVNAEALLNIDAMINLCLQDIKRKVVG